MISVLGFPLEAAVARLEAAGYAVQTCEVHCRKGASGTDLRVLRQSLLDDRRMLLTYAGFATRPQQ